MEVKKQVIREREAVSEHPFSPAPQIPDGCGTLPACAPLANPYVPYQPEGSAVYPAKEGVIKGTMFPGLNLPFRGMENRQPLSDTPMHELQALGFAVVELGEYLDTHPKDAEAFALFRSYAELYQKGMQQYAKDCAPLTQCEAAQHEVYRWIESPWPWDYEANKEG